MVVNLVRANVLEYALLTDLGPDDDRGLGTCACPRRIWVNVVLR